MNWWVARGFNDRGQCVRMKVSDDEGEVRAIAQDWQDTALMASASVVFQKILNDWAPGQMSPRNARMRRMKNEQA